MACPFCGREHPPEACPSIGLPFAKPAAALAVGEILDGKYRIIREIGRGAMGVVYEGLHMALGRRVAIKSLIDPSGTDAELGARFEREARAASAIGHPNIVDVFDLGRTETGLLYMVMELLDGESLEAKLRRTPRLPVETTLHIMIQVLSGLQAAHKNGIVHRDLKPDNIFVIDTEERPNFVKIVDFGISKILGQKGARPDTSARFAGTMVGSVLGTPLYMSPEQAIGQVEAIDHRTDIYAAGVVMYEMLCGRTPVLGANYAQIMGGILEGNYPPPRAFRPDISPELESAILRALARDMEERFPTAAAMRAEIAQGSVDLTPGPGLLPSSVSGPIALTLGTLGDPGPTSAPVSLLERAPPPMPTADAPASSLIDPFAPPPESNVAPLLLGHKNPLPAPTIAHGDAIAIDRPARRRTPAREETAPAPWPAARGRSPSRSSSVPWLFGVAILLALAAGGRFAYTALRGNEASNPLAHRGDGQNVFLSVEPREASVQIDHIPVTTGVLPLDTASRLPHVLNAASPGRVTRRFSFTMKAGMKIAVRLGHTLGAPGPSDPPPTPAELAIDYPDSPRPAVEIDRAFDKLGRYADCLAMVGDLNPDAKKGSARGRLRVEEYGLCRRLISEAGRDPPDMPELQSAGEAYMAALQGGRKLDNLNKLASTFQAEFLAARAAWQMEELSRQGRDDGMNAGWHVRRVALAGQAWQRARKASPALGKGGDPQRAKLDEYLRAMKDYAHKNPTAWEHVVGASDFVQAADELAELAHGQNGKHATEIASLDACRKLLTAFDALVLE